MDHDHRDFFTKQKISAERAVYVAWFSEETRAKIFDIYASLVSWEAYAPQLIETLGEPTILLHSDEIYAHRRAGQAKTRARHRKTLVAKRKKRTFEPDEFYIVDLRKKEKENVTLFRQI